MKRLPGFLLFILLISTVYTSATVINIPADYPHIQQGINSSADGDTVLVQPGTYIENINFNGHNIVLGSLFLTTADTSYISQTVIDGDSVGTVVTFENGEDSSTIITGFNIQNGYANFGGGVFCRNSSPALSNNIVSYNVSDSGGGGIYCSGIPGPAIIDNFISDNYTYEKGGGIFCIDSSNAAISGNIINQNWARTGGGICLSDKSNIKITDNIISLNTTLYWGGGIECRSSTLEIENNVIYRNTAGSLGGGILIFNGLVSLVNDVITNNTATNRGGGIGCTNVSFVTMKNCIIWHNNAPENNEIMEDDYLLISYSDVGGGWPGQGNIDIDPMFRDTINGDYHLMAITCGDSLNSPCIDAGDPDIFDSVLDCRWGLGSETSDIGGFSGGAPSTYVGGILNVPSPYGTIQNAINASRSRDTVLVQPGTYTETIEIRGKNIMIGSMYIITGNPDYISSTIINGNNQNSVVTFYNTGRGSASIIGFTITRGNAQEHGGGIYCFNSSPLIDNNIITDNEALGYYMEPKNGGGIYCGYYSDAKIVNNLITENTADNGGGISVLGSNPLIDGNIISDNLASDTWQFGSGGGMHIFGNPVICNNIINYNESNDAGGGVFCYHNTGGTFINNIFHRNRSGSIAGAIVIDGCDPLLIHNVFYANITSPWTGIPYAGALYAQLSSAILVNNIFYQDSGYYANEIYATPSCSLSISYCDIWETTWPGEGNIDIDPLFRNPANGDFHLMSTACGEPYDSPCIDAGDPNILDSLLDCSWGLGGTRSDMGAYGGGDSLVTAVFDDIPSIPVDFMLLQNYPNPFNAQTNIRFLLPKSMNVELTVYDLLGRQIGILIDEYMEAGTHKIEFNASSLSSGVYFYRLQAGDIVETRRMVLLK